MSGTATDTGIETGIETGIDLAAVVGAVPDPEIPVLTIAELGILRGVSVGDGVGDGGRVTVTITPTYSGCPAMDTIAADVRRALHERGHRDVEVRLVLSPAWTTDWMTESGRAKLAEHGIAPPAPRGGGGPPRTGPSTIGPPRTGPVPLTLSVRCPHCGSPDTRELSRFASTACKALWVCRACSEPFDHFKTH